MYWLFKRYIKRLIDEYAEAYDVESRATHSTNMSPDIYWLQQYLDGKFEWVSDGRGGCVRRGK